MRALRALPVVALLALTACHPKTKRHHAPAASEPTYLMPFSVGPVADGAPAAPASAASAAPAHTAAAVPNPYAGGTSARGPACLADAGTRADCEAALADAAKTGAGAEQALGFYEKACKLKAKLYGCGVFKSTAVGEGDKPLMRSLALCESGAWEHCEDVKSKSAPLIAWHGTLKNLGCKAGAVALCPSYKAACKGKAQWGCAPATDGSGGDVCGCLPRCEGGFTAALASQRAWADGTKRGTFACK